MPPQTVSSISSRLAVFLTALPIVSLGFLTPAHSAPADATVIVLDVSNSMWGQVEGRSKIEIARQVIGELIRDWDPKKPLGLVAYGHRRAGDCSDIQTVIPVGTVDPKKFQAIVNKLTPRGKTPLTAAVRKAAAILNYADVPATVILISDGIESCRADPCKLAAELEKGGLDFTAHVIGFDIGKVADKSQLQCLAEKTGGKFLTAETASQLASALKQVVKVAPPTTAAITLEAVRKAGGAVIFEPGLKWTVVGLSSEEDILRDAAKSQPKLKLKPGRYFAQARLGQATGKIEFDVSDLKAAKYQVVLRIPVTLSAPETAEVGEKVAVKWTGPGAAADYLSVAKADDTADSYLSYARLGGGSPAGLAMPKDPGAYEIRYIDGAAGKVLAKVIIKVIDLSAKLTAPETAEIGAKIQVGWGGPGAKNDYIAVAEPKSKATQYLAYGRIRDGNPVMVTMPGKPGTYELRYIALPQQKIAGKIMIRVTDYPASLTAPPTAIAGSRIDVAWTGPARQRDYIAVVKKGADRGKYINYAYTSAGTPAKVTMPVVPGDYELRYVLGRSLRVLSQLPIKIEAAKIVLNAPPTANVGATIEVIWTGPDNNGNFITVMAKGAPARKYGKYAYTRTGSPVKLLLPITPGDYELRYLSGQGYKTLASLPITLKAVETSLTAPPSANIGGTIDVAWTGPNGRGDFITVVTKGAPARKFGKYAYTRTGSPVKLLLPITPGDYELRYLSGQGYKTLASLPITLKAVETSLTASPSANIGGTIDVSWTGPNGRGDFITVVAKGAPARKYGKYAYTRTGSPVKLLLPITPGDYELRYLSGQGYKTLASLPITLKAVDTSLTAPPTANIGSTIDVAWTGPNSRGDFITVVAKGAPARKFGKYAYTRTGSPVKLLLPIAPGDYELRYLSGQGKKTLASLPIRLIAVKITLSAPPSANAGSTIDVVWTGPNNQRDYLTVVKLGAPKHKPSRYVYTRAGSPLQLLAPGRPGKYELRYVSGQGKKKLAAIPITINEVRASLDAPPAVDAASELLINWSGPGYRRDYITLVADGAPENRYGRAVRLRQPSPARMISPKEPGNYELRYVMGNSRRILARIPITVR